MGRQQRDMNVLLGELTTNGWVYVAEAQGVALLFNECQYRQLRHAQKMHGTVICSPQYHSFIWQ